MRLQCTSLHVGTISNCTLWTTGEFRPPLQPAVRPGAMNLTTSCNSTFVTGDWLPNNRQFCGDLWPNCKEFLADPTRPDKQPLWYPHTCTLYLPKPGELLHMLSGKTMVIHGDSMFRQLFHRLIAHIRGGSVSYDRCHYHGSIVYTFNSTHDSMTSYEDKSWDFLVQDKRLKELPSTVSPGNARIMYIWAPRDMLMPVLSSLKPQILIFGPMYWYGEHDVPFDWKLHAYTLQQHGVQMYYLTTALSGTGNGVRCVHGQQLRNFEMYGALHGLVNFVPFHEIAGHAVTPKIESTHFACNYQLDCGPFTTKNTATYPAELCYDPVNLSTLRLLLSVAYKRHVMHVTHAQRHHSRLLHGGLS